MGTTKMDATVDELGALLIKLVTQGAQTLWDRSLLAYSQGADSVDSQNKIRLEVHMDNGKVLRFNKNITAYEIVESENKT